MGGMVTVHTMYQSWRISVKIKNKKKEENNATFLKITTHVVFLLFVGYDRKDVSYFFGPFVVF